MIAAFEEGAVRGFLHTPERRSGHAIALTHGAGSNCKAPLLAAVAEEFAASGFVVLRFDLPFRQARPSGPPHPGSAARDREGIRDAAAALQRVAAGPVYLGGHSYGGRQATMLAAGDPTVAAGLLLLSYPLHPPRRPDQLRTSHFPQLTVPALFVHGSRDPFGSPEEMRAALALIPGRVELAEIEGAGHDLKRAGTAALTLKHFNAFMFSSYNPGNRT
jgi:predicted alpha/beta-hydrolase family hydrolase